MKFSRRIQNVQPSMTLSITALAADLRERGEDVISFGAGEPDFQTPGNIKDAGIEAINGGQTHYTPVAGTHELKAAIAGKLLRENSLEYDPPQIVVSCGAKHSFYNLAQVLWEEGDEVLVPAPYWVSYPDMISLAEAKPVIVTTTGAAAFKVTPQQLEAAVTANTRALILNSPCNPTGSAYTREELEALAEWALQRDLLVVSDEIYENIVFDGFRPISIAALGPEMKARCVVINGVSKSYAMTGWRIGYLAAEKAIAAQVAKLQSQSTSNPCSISQAAAIEALDGPQDAVSAMTAEFSSRRDILMERIARIPGMECFRPAGSFYAFPDVSAFYGKRFDGKTISGSLDFAEYLLEQAKVAVVPGVAFGADPHVRISFATSTDNLTEGLDRIAEAVRLLE